MIRELSDLNAEVHITVCVRIEINGNQSTGLVSVPATDGHDYDIKYLLWAPGHQASQGSQAETIMIIINIIQVLVIRALSRTQ